MKRFLMSRALVPMAGAAAIALTTPLAGAVPSHAGALAWGGGAGADPVDDAAKQAVGEVVVLYATNDGKGIDPSLGDMPQLQSPPFSAYDSYALLERGKVDLSPSGSMTLPDGGALSLRLESAADDRFTVVASITKKSGKKFLPGATVNAKRGEYFFLAGQRYKEGILVLGIRLVDKKR
ncbi:MAG: hypothetical protein AAF928_02570 [Myxococcota bacterium]